MATSNGGGRAQLPSAYLFGSRRSAWPCLFTNSLKAWLETATVFYARRACWQLRVERARRASMFFCRAGCRISGGVWQPFAGRPRHGSLHVASLGLAASRWQRRSWKRCCARSSRLTLKADGNLVRPANGNIPKGTVVDSNGFIHNRIYWRLLVRGLCRIHFSVASAGEPFDLCVEHFRKSGDAADGVRHASHAPYTFWMWRLQRRPSQWGGGACCLHCASAKQPFVGCALNTRAEWCVSDCNMLLCFAYLFCEAFSLRVWRVGSRAPCALAHLQQCS